MELNNDLREFIQYLNSHRVNYLIVGAHALAWHGLPRYTKDLDIWVEISDENADRIMAAIAAFGFGSTGLSRADFLKKDYIIQLGQEPFRIDLMTGISGLTWDEAWKSKVEGTLDELPVSYLGSNAFMKNKTASGRPQDVADVTRLKAIMYPNKK